MRAVLSLLLSIIVALHGSVGAYGCLMPCPMGATPEVSWTDDGAVQDIADCCNDAETAAKTGKFCKANSPCGSSAAGIAVVLPDMFLPAPPSGAVPGSTVPGYSFDAHAIWRPPTAG